MQEKPPLADDVLFVFDMSSVATNMPAQPRPLSDVVGCVFFVGLAVFTILRAPAQVLFLLPSLLHDCAMGVAFVLRRPAHRQAKGWRPHALAYACTFLVVGFVAMISRYRPAWIAVTPNRRVAAAGLLLWLLGTVLSVWTVWVLRHAFSLVPQARILVTRGPFRLARHPIYASYVLQYAGFWLMHESWALAGVLALWMCLTLLRAQAEEAVLMESFSEYAQYRKRVPPFGLWMPQWVAKQWRWNPAPRMEAAMTANAVSGPIRKAG